MVSICKETETWRNINNKMYLRAKLGFEPRVFVVLHSHPGSAAFSNPQEGSIACTILYSSCEQGNSYPLPPVAPAPLAEERLGTQLLVLGISKWLSSL